MNRTLTFVTIAILAVAGFITLSIFAPDQINLFVTLVGSLTGFAVLLIQVEKLTNKVDKVDKQTNGTNNVLLAAALSGRQLTAEEIETLKDQGLRADDRAVGE